MKKYILSAIVFVLLLSIYSISSAVEKDTPRKLTLMVYMCGSNLESSNNSATADILEMRDAVPSDGSITVLAMTGGTQTDGVSGFFMNNVVEIHEITSGKSRCIWQSDTAISMGSRNTLSFFLKYGIKYYAAQEYALILWDHGGGPLGGICWDELYEMDNLSLTELTEALDSGLSGKKLSWIGFDACLMCSAEVASAISPYANHMIASEEMEPASGWDYSFLRDISRDENGAATGKRIIDCYFASLENSGASLILSCIDLNKVSILTQEMNRIFSKAAGQIHESDFNLLSLQRMESASFGKGQHDAGLEGYDLVDLASLLEHYRIADEEVSHALEETIIYCRSTREGVSGLSVYHPYNNKRRYTDSWRNDYRRLHFCEGYTQYAETFGSFLLSETTTDWSGLYTKQLETAEDKKHHFQLQLSPEQQADFVSAQLLILQDCSNYPYDKLKLSPVFAESVQMNEEGMLAAEYNSQLVFAVDNRNEPIWGPLCFQIDPVEDEIHIYSRYMDNTGRADSRPAITVLMFCDMPGKEPRDLNIKRKYVYDRSVGTYTSRLSFSEDDYSEVLFYSMPRIVPDTAGTIPDFFLWEETDGPIVGIDAKSWHLRTLDNRLPGKMYAMFQITDSRQNVYSSIPVLIENKAEMHYSLSPSMQETDELSMITDVFINTDDIEPAFKLKFDFTNKTDHTLRIDMDQFVFNNEISVNQALIYTDLEAKSTLSMTVSLDSDDLTGFSQLLSIDALLKISDKNDTEKGTVLYPVHLLINNCDISQFASPRPPILSEYRSNGITWQLLSISQDTESDGLKGLFYVQNDTDEVFHTDGILCLNEYLANTYLQKIIQPHTGCYVPFYVAAYEQLAFISVSSRNNLIKKTIDDLPKYLGIRQIDHIRFFHGLDLYQDETDLISFSLDPPFQLPEDLKEVPESKPLLEGDVSVDLAGIYVADDEIALILIFRNNTENHVRLFIEAPLMNGLAAKCGLFDNGDILLPPGTVCIHTARISPEKAIPEKEALREVSFSFRQENNITEAIQISFPESTFLGADGGTWLPAKQLNAACTDWKKQQMIVREDVDLPNRAPEKITLFSPIQTPEDFMRTTSIRAVICTPFHEEVSSGGTGGHIRFCPILECYMEPGAKRFSAVLSGFALKAENQLIPVEEKQISPHTWQIESDYSLYFYENSEDYRPSAKGQLTSDYSKKAEIDITLDILNGSVNIQKNNTAIKKHWNADPYQTNYPLKDISMAAIDRTIYDWYNRPGFVNYTYFWSSLPLPMEDSLKLELIPLSEIKEKYIIYVVWCITDDPGILTRKDYLVDWETGEIIRSSPGC